MKVGLTSAKMLVALVSLFTVAVSQGPAGAATTTTPYPTFKVWTPFPTPRPCYPRNFHMIRQAVTGRNAQMVIDMAAADLEVEYGLSWSGLNSDVISCTADSVCQQRWALVLRMTNVATKGVQCYQITMHADVQADLFTVLDDKLL